MSMANHHLMDIHRCFKLKPSRLSVMFQCLLLLFIAMSLYQVLSIAVFILSIGLVNLSYFIFIRQAQIEQLEQLDASDWTLCYRQSGKMQHAQIIKMIDHHLYIVIYFQSTKLQPLIIWRDQLSEISWKSLKTRVKLT